MVDGLRVAPPGKKKKKKKKKTSNGKEGEMKPSAVLEGRKGSAPLGYSGRAALRRELCDAFA
jgi:hypothetical protein